MYKAVFMDIDGTLTSFKTHSIPDSAKRALALARERGVKVFAATGRNLFIPLEAEVVSDIAFDGAVMLNGQLCSDSTGEIFYREPLDMEDSDALLRLCDENGIPALVVTERNLYITLVNDIVRVFHDYVALPIPEVKPAKEFIGKELFNVGPYALEGQQPMIESVMKHSAVTRWSPYAFDTIPKDGGKHIGVVKMLDRLGISPDEAIAFGDGENDISMMKCVATGVAMAGSGEAVTSAADFVADPVDEDGIYKAFVKYNII